MKKSRSTTLDRSLDSLAREAQHCRRCLLYKMGTQTVFGEGPAGASLFLVGEQPGDQEDLAGRPFVGPAGRILDRALKEAGIDREQVYVTNAVKHFKHDLRGKRRLHKRPNRYEIERCRWWLDKEIAIVRPGVILALGVTAASILLGRAAKIGRDRRTPLEFLDGKRGVVTIHPSAVLRMPEDAARRKAFAELVGDIRYARELAAA